MFKLAHLNRATNSNISIYHREKIYSKTISSKNAIVLNFWFNHDASLLQEKQQQKKNIILHLLKYKQHAQTLNQLLTLVFILFIRNITPNSNETLHY